MHKGFQKVLNHMKWGECMYSVHVREQEWNMQALFLMSGKYTVCGYQTNKIWLSTLPNSYHTLLDNYMFIKIMPSSWQISKVQKNCDRTQFLHRL